MPKFTEDDFKHKENEELYRLRPNIILGPYHNEKITDIVFKDGKFELQTFTSSIASRQTFRETVSNAIDNVRRAIKDGDIDPGVITVVIEEQENDNPIFTITNGGHMPPFSMHKKLGIPIPQAIVGVFNTGTNYEEGVEGEENRLGGQNGIGSKANNLFSKWFELTIIDGTIGQKYFQRFEEFEPQEYEISPTKAKKNMFKVHYQPNDGLGTPNIYWCACDVLYAAITSYNKVFLTINGETTDLSNLHFKDILKFYPPCGDDINNYDSSRSCDDENSEEEPKSEEVKEPKSEEVKEEITEEQLQSNKRRRKKAKIVKPVKEIYNGPATPTILLHWKDKLGNEVIIADVHKSFPFRRAQGWVNGIPCHTGIHINEAVKVFTKAFIEKMSTVKQYADKLAIIKPKPKFIRDNIFVLVKVEVVKPKFGSGQIKDNFTAHGHPETITKIDLSLFDKNKPNPNGKEPEKWGDWKNSYLMNRVTAFWNNEADKKLSQTDGKKTKHVKSKNYAVKANWAGTDKSEECSAIGCEGDSAKQYADKHRALTPNGNNTIGIFTFRGKVLNTLNATPEQLLDNAELTELKRVLGLREGLDYSLEENMKTLRYGKEFVIMADADDDGTHIKGLVILFFYTRFPTLLKRGYVTAFFSPVLRVPWNNELYRFYRFEAYLRWLKEDPKREKAKPKYFKGLASSDDDDIQDDYTVAKRIKYKLDKNADYYITLAFNGEYSDARKEWLAGSDEISNDIPDNIQKISDFIDEDLVVFFKTSIRRAIPDIDGFKDVQRKLVWALRNVKTSARVNVLASRVIEATKYHHGDQSISKALLLMVQNFAGTNNLPLFTANGQFGSRFDPKPPAARYPSTRITPIFDKIFPKIDEHLLNKKYEEGEEIEPEVLLPIIPLILINGAKGVGAGWSTFIPSYEPKAILTNMRRLVRGQKTHPMIPYYKGYNGIITLTETGFKSQGILQNRGKSWRVSELPLWFWTKDFKDHLDTLLKPDTNDPYQPSAPVITDYRQNNAKLDIVDYTIDGPTIATFEKLAKEDAKRNKVEYKPKEPMDSEELYEKTFKIFKLESNHSMQNMVLLVNGVPKHFKTVEEIMIEFYNFRMPFYEKRYNFLAKNIEDKILDLEKKLIIAKLFLEGKVSTRDDDLYEKIIEHASGKLSEDDVTLFLDKNSISTIVKITKGTKKIEEEITKLRTDLEALHNKTAKDLWIEDLDSLEKALKKNI